MARGLPRLALFLALLLAAPPLAAQGRAGGDDLWLGRLPDGRSVMMDPSTRRPVVVGEQGRRTQLWDGVHRLEDGGTLRVRSGVVVPDRQVLESQEGRMGDRQAPPVAEPCRALRMQACGLYGECDGTEACRLANQVASASETTGGAWDAIAPQRQCAEALRDMDLFPPCPERRQGASPTPCERLTDKVCGARGQCADAPACPPARQLAEMEYLERARAGDPDAATASTDQCRTALQDESFFRPCGEVSPQRRKDAKERQE
jgi:hypothetical protein